MLTSSTLLSTNKRNAFPSSMVQLMLTKILELSLAFYLTDLLYLALKIATKWAQVFIYFVNYSIVQHCHVMYT